MEYEDLNDEEKKERDRLYQLSKPLGMHNQPERLNPEEVMIKTEHQDPMIGNDQWIRNIHNLCDSPNSENK